MTTPHEYMDEYGEWNLHSFHNSDLYNDPDYIANDADYQLPLLSTLGRGPRGAGIKVVESVNEDLNDYRLSFVNDETGEAFVTTPNLDPGHIEVTWPQHNRQEGEVGWMTVSWRRGADVRSYDVALPPGAHGSRLYLSDLTYAERDDKTYVTSVSDLIHYGLKTEWRDKPTPRPGDIVAFAYKGTNVKSLGFGTIESVTDTEVVFTSRTKIGIPIPEISENETWIIDGVDTGIPTRGQKANVVLGNVETLPSMSKASVSTSYDEETNTTTLNFGIPEGPVGKTVEVQGGVWTVETLPDFDTTPVNDAFVVRDGDKQFDLYVRGQQESIYDEYRPWTVVEDWQGRPGAGMHVMLEPYSLDREPGSVLRIPAAEASLAFSPTEYLTDGAVVLDSTGVLGILGSSEDNSGDYTVTTTSSVSLPNQSFTWTDVKDKPFESVGDGLYVNGGTLFVDVPKVDVDCKWPDIMGKPFESIGETLFVDEDGSLQVVPANSSSVAGVPVIGKSYNAYGAPGVYFIIAEKDIESVLFYLTDKNGKIVSQNNGSTLSNDYGTIIINGSSATINLSKESGFSYFASYVMYADGTSGQAFFTIPSEEPTATQPVTEFVYLDHNIYANVPTRRSSGTLYRFSVPVESKQMYVKFANSNLATLATFSAKVSDIADKVTTVNEALTIEVDTTSSSNRIDVFLETSYEDVAYIDVRSFSEENTKLTCLNAATVFTVHSESSELPEVATVEETKAYLGIQ